MRELMNMNGRDVTIIKNDILDKKEGQSSNSNNVIRTEWNVEIESPRSNHGPYVSRKNALRVATWMTAYER